MACHEIAALRLGLMRMIGINDEAERQHELSELGACVARPGPLKSLAEAQNLESLKRFFQTSLSDLEERVSREAPDDPKRPYHQTLIVLTKKVEQELDGHIDDLARFYRNLEEIHDFLHEIYPSKTKG
jgi:hypothetical protein